MLLSLIEFHHLSAPHIDTHLHCDQKTTIAVLIERCNLRNGSHETFRECACESLCVHGVLYACNPQETHTEALWYERKRERKKLMISHHLLSSSLFLFCTHFQHPLPAWNKIVAFYTDNHVYV